MKRTRFSIAGLMGFVVIVALGFGGLKEATPMWASACFTVAFVGLIAGSLIAFQARGRSRAFWTGFAVSGWIYFASMFAIGSPPRVNAPPLLIELLLDRMEPMIHPPFITSVLTSTATPITATTSIPTLPTAPPAAPFIVSFNTAPLNYRQVGHSLAALLVGYLGGSFSVFIAARRGRGEAIPDEEVSPSSP